MKKIMKKVMSLALVVMMVASLLPMTVFADDGVTTVVDSKEYTAENTWSPDNTEITTTDWTRITVTIESASDGWDFCINQGQSSVQYSSSASDATTQTYDVAPDSEVYVQMYVGAENGTVTYSITTETIEAPAEGSELNPKEVSWDQEVTIAAGATMYFKTMPYSNGDYRLTIEGGAASDSFKFYIPGSGMMNPATEINAVDATLKSPIFSIDTEYNPSYSYQVINTGANDVVLNFTIDSVVGATTNYPDTPDVGENTVEIDSAYSGYYYQWVAPEAGTLTVAIDTTKTDVWLYRVDNIAASKYGDEHTSDDDEIVATETLTVSAGDVVDIMIGTAFDQNSMSWPQPMVEGTVNWTLGFVAADGVADSKGFEAKNSYTPDNTEIITTDWTRVTVTIETGGNWEVYLGQDYYSSETANASSMTLDVAPDQTVYVQVYAPEGEVVTYKITTETIDAPAVGTELNPVVVESEVTQTIPAGATMYFVSKPALEGEYILNVTGETTDAFRFYIAGSGQWWDPGVDLSAVNGALKVYFSQPEYSYSIINSSDAAIELSFAHAVATGTYSSQATPVVGENTTEIVTGQTGYYYQWTATQAGTVTVTMDTENNTTGWNYLVANYDAGNYGERYTSGDETINASTSISVAAGEIVNIEINTYNAEDPYTQYAGTVNWTFAFTSGTGTGTTPNPDPTPVVGTEDAPNTTLATNGTASTITVAPGATYYFSVLATPGEYDLTVVGATGFVVGTYEDLYPNMIETADTNGTAKVKVVSPRTSSTINFVVVNNTESSQNYRVSLAPATTEGGEGGSTNAPDGTYEKPFEITTNGKYTATCNYDNIYYTFTATADGVLTLVISEEDANNFKNVYAYELNGEPLDRGTDKTTNTTEVKKGDVIVVKAYSSTTLDFTATFEEGAEKEDGPTTKPETNAGDKYTELVSGTATLDTTVVTTLFELTPDKVGTYTITAPTGVKVEDWNTPTYPFNKTENATNTVTIECSAVGQSFLVGFTAADGITKVDVTITFKAAEQKEEVDWTIFGVTATLEKFETVLEDLEYVDVEDETVDKAVLGKDGFYHLNAANGPILYVDLNDELMSLVGAADLGKVVEYVTEDGEIIAKISYNEAVLEYAAVANKDGLYPLTADLMTIYKNAGAYAGWYGEDGFLGFTEEDAWMFACYYVPGSEDKEADNTVVAPLPAPEEGKDVVVDNEYLDEYIEQAVQSGAPLELPTTNENVTMTFDANELAENDEIVLNLTVNVVDDAKDETVAKNDKITDKNFVLKVEFSHEGKLPAEAVISIQLPATIAEKYEKLFYYQIMADGSLKFVCDAPVVDGVAKVTQDHCSDYVLLTEKIVEAPLTGDSTNVVLWFAVLALGVAAIAGSVVMRKKEF